MKRTEILIKAALFGLGIVLALICLNGCDLGLGGGSPGPGNLLSVTVNPSSGYPPLDVTITAAGVTEGQYTFIVGGHTYIQGSNIKRVTLHLLPCEGEVVWERPGYVIQKVTFNVTLDNEGPDPGQPVINGIRDLWTLQSGVRYLISFPDARDPDGGPVTLVDVHVQASLKLVEDTVFCPPYAGQGVYHARDRTGHLIENAFVIHSLWTGPLDAAFNVHPFWKATRYYEQGDYVNWNGKAYECKRDNNTVGFEPGVSPGWKGVWIDRGPVGYGTNLPFAPPGYPEAGYPGAGTNCGIDGWPHHDMPTQMTTITATFRDQDGATTKESWEIPTMPYAICGAD